jgi:Amt family ammonium transporter
MGDGDLLYSLKYKEKMEKCILSLLEISNSASKSEDEIIQQIIDNVVELTSSECGYLHLFNPDENTIHLKVWSKLTMEYCNTVYDNHYPLESAGIWADCARIKTPVIHNDYESVEHKKGLPEGHFPIIRHLSVPVISDDRVVVIIGVGNKKTDYDETDIKHMEVITQNLWRVILNNRYAQKIIKINEELKFDSLTGVYNRKEFENIVEHFISNDDNANILAYIDLDNFKIINDSVGHKYGDETLKIVTNIIKSEIRKTDIVGRLGGDEFSILFINCKMENAALVCSKILHKVTTYSFMFNDVLFKIGLSIGITILKNSVGESLEEADSACYISKNSGKGQIKIYDKLNLNVIKRKTAMLWAEQLPKFINNEKLKLFVQPITNLKTNNKHSYEILLRINKDGKLENPISFLEAAETYNLSIDVDKFVINSVIQYFKSLDLSRVDMFFINLTSTSVSNLEFHTFLKDIVINCSHPNMLCFEITETSAINNLDKVIPLINELKEYGCKFALDDFGTGFSSFKYLKEIPADIIKIDGIFVKDISDNAFSKMICKSISEISHILNLKVIAECIETGEVLDEIKKLNIEYGQGYYFKFPHPIEDLIKKNIIPN